MQGVLKWWLGQKREARLAIVGSAVAVTGMVLTMVSIAVVAPKHPGPVVNLPTFVGVGVFVMLMAWDMVFRDGYRNVQAWLWERQRRAHKNSSPPWPRTPTGDVLTGEPRRR